MKSSTEANSVKFPFLLLPMELQAATISWLEVTDLFTFSLTCKQVHVECNRQSVWRDLSSSCFHDIPEHATCISWRKYFYYRNIFLHPTKTLLQWRQLQSSTLPSPRQSLSGTYCRGKVVFIGGQTSVTTRFDDVYYFDPDTFVFTKPKIHGELPPKFARHSAVEINGKIYVFGGFDGFGTFFGLAAFDLDTQSWSYPKTKGAPPVPRTNHAVAVVGTKMFLFGGNDTTRVGGEELKYGTFGDFLVLDVATLTWSQPKTKGKAPSPRSGHHMVSIGNKIWLFGGGLWNDKNKSWMERYSDMFVFDAETMEWTEVKQQNEPHSTFISLPHWVVNNFIFVYNDPLFCFDTITCKWYQLKTRGNNRPQKRFLTPATLVPNKNSVFLFGGVYTTVVNNLDQLVWPANIFHILSKETGIDTNES